MICLPCLWYFIVWHNRLCVFYIFSRARDLISGIQEEKSKEAKEEEKKEEKERRKLGKEMQKLREWKEDRQKKDEMKEWKKEREEKKKERERVKEMLARDRYTTYANYLYIVCEWRLTASQCETIWKCAVLKVISHIVTCTFCHMLSII